MVSRITLAYNLSTLTNLFIIDHGDNLITTYHFEIRIVLYKIINALIMAI
jgi:hypothetical protein